MASLSREETLIMIDRLEDLPNDEFLSIISTCLLRKRDNLENLVISSELLALIVSVVSVDSGRTDKSFEDIAHTIIDATCKDLKEKMLEPMQMIHAEKINSMREGNKHV